MYEPQGPLPREVYLRRRVAAAVAAVVVLALIVTALYLASRDGGTDTQDVATTGEQQAGTDPSASTSATTSTTAAGSTGEQPSRGRCADEDLALRVNPAQPNVPAGSELRFYAEVVNTSDTACDRDLSGAPLSFEVYRLDTNAKVWSSIDCTTPKGEDKVVLQPDSPVARQIDWSGRRSAPGACSSADRTPVDVGYYQVYALVGKVFSPAATFNVVEPAGGESGR